MVDKPGCGHTWHVSQEPLGHLVEMEPKETWAAQGKLGPKEHVVLMERKEQRESHWFTSSVWNFCRWVANVPPRETSLSGEERGETSAVRRLHLSLRMSIRNFWPWLYSTSSNQVIFTKKIDCHSTQMLFTFFICSSELWLCKEIPGLFPPCLLCW